MKTTILNHLKGTFKRQKKREPSELELKRMDYLAFMYSRDLKYILKMEMKEFRFDKKFEEANNISS